MSTDLKGMTVLAIGGHSLIDPKRPPSVPNQFAVTARALKPVADLIQQGERLILTHGNGPQVGFMQMRSEISAEQLHMVPLDSLVADTQGALAYMIQRALREELRQRGIRAPVASLVTEVEVAADDDAFREPTKPVGRFFAQEEANRLMRAHGWRMVEDAGRGWRRVVPSPIPLKIVQIDAIRTLARDGVTVVCCGGGGIPVTRDQDGHIIGVEGVIDKDRTSAVLAVVLNASRLIITTGVDAVYADYLSSSPRRLDRLTVSEVKALDAEGQFSPGSMGPKMEAAIYFLERGGAEVIICLPTLLNEAVHGRSGTRIVPD